MKNKDLLKQENMKLMQRLSEALKEDNEEAGYGRSFFTVCIRGTGKDHGRIW